MSREPPWGRAEKEAYKAGLKKGIENAEVWQKAAYNQGKEDAMGIKEHTIKTKTDILIEAINNLTAEIKKTSDLREKQIASTKVTDQDTAAIAYAKKREKSQNAKMHVKTLQTALGLSSDGVIGVAEMMELRRLGLAVGMSL